MATSSNLTGRLSGLGGGGGGGAPAPFPIPSSTYAALPDAAANSGLLRRVTDANNSIWESNGVRWAPVNGEFTMFALQGSIAAPLATVTGVTAARFVLPGGNPTIPAGLMKPGSKLWVTAALIKRGATSVFGCALYLGTTDTTSDAALYNRNNLSTNNGASTVLQPISTFDATNRLVTSDYTGWSSTASGGLIERTANVDTMALQYVSCGIQAANAADAFDLLHLTAIIRP